MANCMLLSAEFQTHQLLLWCLNNPDGFTRKHCVLGSVVTFHVHFVQNHEISVPPNILCKAWVGHQCRGDQHLILGGRSTINVERINNQCSGDQLLIHLHWNVISCHFGLALQCQLIRHKDKHCNWWAFTYQIMCSPMANCMLLSAEFSDLSALAVCLNNPDGFTRNVVFQEVLWLSMYTLSRTMRSHWPQTFCAKHGLATSVIKKFKTSWVAINIFMIWAGYIIFNYLYGSFGKITKNRMCKANYFGES